MALMTTRAARLAKGWVVGALATAMAAASHALAGGGTPSALALVTGVVFGGMLATLALSARPSLPRLAIAVGGSQLAFHVVFTSLSAGGTVTGSSMPGMHGAMVSIVGTPHAHVEGPAMWLGHAVAGVLTLALLRGAERAVWRALTQLARLVVRATRILTPDLPVVAAPVTSVSPARLSGRLLDAAVSRRGPPHVFAF
jgi:hypothetical protein